MKARGHGGSGPVSASVRVLVAGESRAMRSALRRMLGADRRLDVVGLASDATEVLRSLMRLLPDVIVIDVGIDPSGSCCRSKRKSVAARAVARSPSARSPVHAS